MCVQHSLKRELSEDTQNSHENPENIKVFSNCNWLLGMAKILWKNSSNSTMEFGPKLHVNTQQFDPIFLWRINSHPSSFSKLNSTPNSSPIYPSEYTWFQIFSFVSLYNVIWLNVYCWKSLDNCFPIKIPNLLMQARS